MVAWLEMRSDSVYLDVLTARRLGATKCSLDFLDLIPGKIDLAIIFISSFMVGFSLSDLVAGWSSVQHLSWSLACPVHCSASCGPWFLAGLCLGSLLSIVAAGFVLFGLRHLVFGLSFGGPPPSFPSRAAARHRLQAYLHE